MTTFSELFRCSATYLAFWADFEQAYYKALWNNGEQAKFWSGTNRHQDPRPAFGPVMKRMGRGREHDRRLQFAWNSGLWSRFNYSAFRNDAEDRGYRFVQTDSGHTTRIEKA